MSTLKLNVLSIQVDVTNLSDLEIEDLQASMLAQCEDAGGTAGNVESFDAPVINVGVNEIEFDDELDLEDWDRPSNDCPCNDCSPEGDSEDCNCEHYKGDYKESH